MNNSHDLCYEIYSKDNQLLWIVKTKEDAERLTQGTHHYIIKGNSNHD